MSTRGDKFSGWRIVFRFSDLEEAVKAWGLVRDVIMAEGGTGRAMSAVRLSVTGIQHVIIFGTDPISYMLREKFEQAFKEKGSEATVSDDVMEACVDAHEAVRTPGKVTTRRIYP